MKEVIRQYGSAIIATVVMLTMITFIATVRSLVSNEINMAFSKTVPNSCTNGIYPTNTKEVIVAPVIKIHSICAGETKRLSDILTITKSKAEYRYEINEICNNKGYSVNRGLLDENSLISFSEPGIYSLSCHIFNDKGGDICSTIILPVNRWRL